MYDYTQPLLRSRLSRENGRQRKEVELDGHTWIVLPDVFSPADSPSSLAQLELLDFPVGGAFLEIGTGTGLIAVTAALAGCRTVYATDLSPAAVENATLNAERFGMSDRVRCVHSDLFDGLAGAPTFDTIYWHSNNTWAPPDLAIENMHELAYVDPGYRAHERFLREARHHVAPGGRVLLGLSSRAGHAELDKLATAAGRRLCSVKAVTVDEKEGAVTYELFEVVPR